MSASEMSLYEVIESLPPKHGARAEFSALLSRIPPCVCGEPTLGVVHRADGPCYLPEQAPPDAVPAGYVPVSALIEAREEVESWAAYATPYFQDKHDLAEVLAKIDGQIAAARRGFKRGLAARKPDRIWQDRNGALRTSPADCQSFGADGWPIAVYYGSQRFPISQHPLTEEDEP